MAKGFRNGPGGVSQNFKVVGGTAQPNNPSENTIWVNTDVEITDYKLSKNEPKNPTEGMVWISLGETSDVAFCTLKIVGREFDEVCPIFAKQYVSGAWVDKTAKIYQDGKWVDWVTYLYNAPNEFEELTGGWTISGFKIGSAGFGNVTKSDTGMTFTGVSGTSYCGVFCANKIDLSNLSTLTVLSSSENAKLELRLSTTKDMNTNASGFYGQYTQYVKDGIATYSLDGITGSYYLGFVEQSLGKCTINEVYAK